MHGFLWVGGYLVLGLIFSHLMYMMDMDGYEPSDIWWVTLIWGIIFVAMLIMIIYEGIKYCGRGVVDKYVSFLNRRRVAVRAWRESAENEVEELEEQIEKEKPKVKESKETNKIPALPVRNNLQSVE